MGKKRFAATISVPEYTTTADRYGNHMTAWIRGWEHGIEIQTFDSSGEDGFEIYSCGGSNPGRSNGRKLIGKVVNGEFIRTQ